MSWRSIKVYNDVILPEDENARTAYIINHLLQHEIGGEQQIRHNQLADYDATKHRQIIFDDALELFVITL